MVLPFLYKIFRDLKENFHQKVALITANFFFRTIKNTELCKIEQIQQTSFLARRNGVKKQEELLREETDL